MRELLLKHGDFKAVEAEVKKLSRQTAMNRVRGGFHNEITLREFKKWDPFFGSIFMCIYIYIYISSLHFHRVLSPIPSYALREMIENSRQWALKRGLLQRNPVHGREEWKIPTEVEFEFENMQLQETETRGSMELEDCHVLCLLISNNPERFL